MNPAPVEQPVAGSQWPVSSGSPATNSLRCTGSGWQQDRFRRAGRRRVARPDRRTDLPGRGARGGGCCPGLAGRRPDHRPGHHGRDPAVLRTAARDVFRRLLDGVDPEWWMRPNRPCSIPRGCRASGSVQSGGWAIRCGPKRTRGGSGDDSLGAGPRCRAPRRSGTWSALSGGSPTRPFTSVPWAPTTRRSRPRRTSEPPRVSPAPIPVWERVGGEDEAAAATSTRAGVMAANRPDSPDTHLGDKR